jgi:hypothetical protein
MDKLRYPIGQFDPIVQPSAEQLTGWIKEIGDFSRYLRQMVQDLTSEQLKTPYRPDGWTIQQVVHHLADNNMNSYLRFKKGLTEDNPLVNSYRQDLWAELNDSIDEPVDTSLLLIQSINSRFVRLLISLNIVDFQRTFISPTFGVLTLNIAIQRYVWHSKHHAAQIKSLKERNRW